MDYIIQSKINNIKKYKYISIEQDQNEHTPKALPNTMF